jgi:Flp pilus assembly protein TadG
MERLPMACIRTFLSTIRRFSGNSSGNVLILFAFSFLPIVMLVGLGIDYGLAVKHRSRLLAAADAATLEAVLAARDDALAGRPDSTAISDGQAQGVRAFTGNVAGIASITAQTPTISVTRSGQSFTAVLTYQATSRMYFGNFFNASVFNLGGTATASVGLPVYQSYYLLLDVSGSMGIPSTTAGQLRLASINPDQLSLYPTGCNFACHFSGYQGYTLTRTNGTGSRVAGDFCPQPGMAGCIQLRLDAVAFAVQQLLQTAQQTQVISNQFSVGLYPFITHMLAYQSVTTSLSTVSSMAANIPSLLDAGVSPNSSGNLGSGGTHFENALPELNALIPTPGDGSTAALPQPIVFLVTDGAQDPQYQSGGSWWGGNHATTIDTSNCTTLKNRGITIAILYVPYVPIANPNPSFATDEDDFANWNIPNIPPALAACASPGGFFTANTPADITTTINNMFIQYSKAARLTQ